MQDDWLTLKRNLAIRGRILTISGVRHLRREIRGHSLITQPIDAAGFLASPLALETPETGLDKHFQESPRKMTQDGTSCLQARRHRPLMHLCTFLFDLLPCRSFTGSAAGVIHVLTEALCHWGTVSPQHFYIMSLERESPLSGSLFRPSTLFALIAR